MGPLGGWSILLGRVASCSHRESKLAYALQINGKAKEMDHHPKVILQSGCIVATVLSELHQKSLNRKFSRV